MSYLVYCATSRTSGGQYIGITSRGLAERRKHHLSMAPTKRICPAFHAAIVKYGRDDFEWETMIDGLEQDEAVHLERFLISTMAPRYNVASGGLSGAGFAGYIRPPETIKRMRAAAKKRGISNATRTAAKAAQVKPIRCVETGTVFPDAHEAALAHGLARNSVYSLIYKGGKSKLAGVSFERV